jgi:hypothetical protein
MEDEGSEDFLRGTSSFGALASTRLWLRVSGWVFGLGGSQLRAANEGAGKLSNHRCQANQSVHTPPLKTQTSSNERSKHIKNRIPGYDRASRTTQKMLKFSGEAS